MKKLLTIFLALAASASMMYASDTQVDGIWYDFDSNARKASVTYGGSSPGNYSDEYFDRVIIPSSVTYDDVVYSVTSIGNHAFTYCFNLRNVTIPNSVICIENSAFEECGLTSVEIPNSVTRIGISAFALCYNLTSVRIGNSVASIGYSAFFICRNLTSIICEAENPPTLGDAIFIDVNKNIPLYVPKQSVDLYKAADQWKDFNPILPIEETEDIELTNGENSEGHTKLLRDGQIYILRGGKMYNAQGMQVK